VIALWSADTGAFKKDVRRGEVESWMMHSAADVVRNATWELIPIYCCTSKQG
jgi:hypothetical protein